jgi:hypothetical protein
LARCCVQIGAKKNERISEKINEKFTIPMSLFLPMPLFLWPMRSGRMVTQRVKHMVFLPKTNGIIAITVAAILFGTAGAFAKLLFTV